jgi:hypothetical protein
MMEHSDIIKYKEKNIVQLLNYMKKKEIFFFHFNGTVSVGLDDFDNDVSPLAKFFEHLAANAE